MDKLKIGRVPKDRTWMSVAYALAEQSTCCRRSVGCVLLDRNGRVLSTGWNGVAAGEPHCNAWAELTLPEARALGDDPRVRSPKYLSEVDPSRPMLGWYSDACPGAFLLSGQGIDSCGAVHAEQNACLGCTRPFDIGTCYTTTSPCVPCVKLLLGSPCARIVFAEAYVDQTARVLWEKAGRAWDRI